MVEGESRYTDSRYSYACTNLFVVFFWWKHQEFGRHEQSVRAVYQLVFTSNSLRFLSGA